MPDALSVIDFFFFNDTATTEIYTLSLHDALPISERSWRTRPARTSTWMWRDTACSEISNGPAISDTRNAPSSSRSDRKSTRLNSSHTVISYAVFCLKKNKHEAPDRRYPTARAFT